MSKPHVLRIIQKDEFKDVKSVGSDIEVYLDGNMINIISIDLNIEVNQATTATIKLLVNPYVELNISEINKGN